MKGLDEGEEALLLAVPVEVAAGLVEGGEALLGTYVNQ